MNNSPTDLDQPLISVLMPVYNTERYLAEAITSILEQTYSNLELIVADDGSTDGSAALIHEFAARDSRVRPLFLEHGGRAKTLNKGVAAARGELLARMDADDIAMPERLATQLAWTRKTGVEVCGACGEKFDQGSGVLWVPETLAAIRAELLFRIALLHPTLLAPTAILKKHPYNEQSIHEDYELWTRLTLHYNVGNVQQALIKIRYHAQQTRVVESAQLNTDIKKYRRIFFDALYPQASEDEYRVLDQIASKTGMANLADLEQAAKWLLQLAQAPDRLLHWRMEQRWQETCARSAPLGPAVYKLYRRTAPQFGVTSKPKPLLWLACMLRQPYSGLELALRNIRSRLPMARVSLSGNLDQRSS